MSSKFITLKQAVVELSTTRRKLDIAIERCGIHRHKLVHENKSICGKKPYTISRADLPTINKYLDNNKIVNKACAYDVIKALRRYGNLHIDIANRLIVSEDLVTAWSMGRRRMRRHYYDDLVRWLEEMHD
jgi:hypothetical protein